MLVVPLTPTRRIGVASSFSLKPNWAGPEGHVASLKADSRQAVCWLEPSSRNFQVELNGINTVFAAVAEGTMICWAVVVISAPCGSRKTTRTGWLVGRAPAN